MMESICEKCWNEGCKADEKLRKEKIVVCQDMDEHPERWAYEDNYVEPNFWDDRTFREY